MAIVEVSIIPVGTGSPSLSRYIAKAIRVLKQSPEAKVKFEINPMGTILEGELEEILHLVRKMHEAIFEEDVRRVVTVMKIDERRDKPQTMEEKVRSVEEKMP